MPPAHKDRKIWNEDLIKALEARAEQKRQQGSRGFISLQDAAHTIMKVRKDIYQFQNGRIVGLPTRGLSATCLELCRGIILGQQPILPPGYVPVLPEDVSAAVGNPFSNHPYLTTIKLRGGAFAILMAFYCSQQTGSLTKDQIIAAGQRFCDEELEANFHAGRTYGAWKSNETLVRHGLIHCNKRRTEYRENVGFRSLGKNTYALTRDGEMFIEALLDRHPAVKQEVNALKVSEPVFMTPSGRSQGRGGYHFVGGGEQFSHTRPLSELALKDVQELHSWVKTASVTDQRVFKGGKNRRKAIHDECDRINGTLHGKELRHESVNMGNTRHLYVTMIAKRLVQLKPSPSSGSIVQEGTLSPPILHPESLFGSTPAVVDSDLSFSAASFSSKGRKLSSTASRSKPQLPASQMAAMKALERQAIHESIEMIRKRPMTVLPSQANGNKKKKPPRKQLAGATPVIDLAGSSGDESSVQLQDNRAVDLKPTASCWSSPVINVDDSSGDESLEVSLVERLAKMKSPPVASSADHHTPNSLKPVTALGSAVMKSTETTGITLIYGSDSHEIVDMTEPQTAVVDLAVKTIPPMASSEPSRTLTLLVDNRERIHNSIPRHIRMELTRMVSNGGILSSLFKQRDIEATVEERKLAVGDFCFANEGGSLSAPPIERKTIGDLVARSFRKEHWFQLQKMREITASSGGVFYLLLEGDMRTAMQHVPEYSGYGDEILCPESHAIDSDESLVRFMGRAMLTCSKRVRFVQTRDLQGSLRAIGAIGLVAAMQYKQQASLPAKWNKSQFSNDLKSMGVHWRVATVVGDEFGSLHTLIDVYKNIDSSACRERALVPLLSPLTEREKDCQGTAYSWSRAIYLAVSAEPSKRNTAKDWFHSMKGLVEDHAMLLGCAYQSSSDEEALNTVLESPQMVDSSPKRVVSVSLPLEYMNCFPSSARGGKSVFSISISSDESDKTIPCITMQTRAGNDYSNKVAVFILEGVALVKSIQESIAATSSSVNASSAAAGNVRLSLSSSSRFDPTKDICVLVVRGLKAASDKWSKKTGYKSEFRSVIDMTMAELSIVHNTVVLQAMRLTYDLEVIVQHLALACFHHQILTSSSDAA